MSWLYILRSGPYTSSRFSEAIDAMLVAGVFEQPIRVLLVDDAVQALRQHQNGEILGSKTPGKMLTALPDYDIQDIFVCRHSLERAGIHEDARIELPVTIVDHAEQAALIAASTQVFSD